MMGWPPEVYGEEVNQLVRDLFKVINERQREIGLELPNRRYYSNDVIICALSMVMMRVHAAEAMAVKENSER